MRVSVYVSLRWVRRRHHCCVPVRILCVLPPPGAFVRPASGFRSRIGSPEYPAAADRYALYVSYACPWASRCIAAIALKGLEHVIQVIPVAAVFVPTRPEEDGHQGWCVCV